MPPRCPGMDPGNWTPTDITEHPCPRCEKTIEFWKDDTRRICPHCNTTVVNPRFSTTCASWCKKADECLGSRNEKE
ncbi:MAG: hypothetical protein GF401_15360 [Chitinivibrionales bacterium]|nr:hypothetical protein [Chitinivibrionales bacterium]